MKDQQGETVAKIVVGEFIAKFGCPLEIHTDQGRNFEGVLFKEMCALLEINKTRTTSFRPSANGQVERLNYSIAQIICCFVGEKQEKWDEYVGLAASAIRATVNRSTGFTPNMLMLGREVPSGFDAGFRRGRGQTWGDEVWHGFGGVLAHGSHFGQRGAKHGPTQTEGLLRFAEKNGEI